jgi:Cys-tRNA(Pro)/Cys-tRNA(Cys) deacylase
MRLRETVLYVAGKGTPATAAAARAKIDHRVHDVAAAMTASDDGYGMAVASAMDVPPAQVCKTLVCEVDGKPVVGVVPVDRMLDLKALAAAVGGKRAQLAPKATAERLTGYVVGGISPLGQRTRLRTVVDSSVEVFATVYVSAGRRGLELELAPADLVTLCGAVTAPIATAG